MPSRARDARYGRRGGRWIDGDGQVPAPPVDCDVCGTPVHTGSRHVSCAPELEPGPPSLFDGEALPCPQLWDGICSAWGATGPHACGKQPLHGGDCQCRCGGWRAGTPFTEASS